MIAFKRPELADQLDLCDPRILALLTAAGKYLFAAKPSRELVVTCVMRKAAEQAAIYAKAQQLGAKEPISSPHEFGRAVDISVQGWPPELIRATVEYLNTRFPYHGAPQFHTAIAHDVGQGNHIHIQVAPPFLKWEMMK